MSDRGVDFCQRFAVLAIEITDFPIFQLSLNRRLSVPHSLKFRLSYLYLWGCGRKGLTFSVASIPKSCPNMIKASPKSPKVIMKGP